MKWIKNNKILLLKMILILAQVVFSVLAIVMVAKVNLLPGRLFIVVIVGIAALLAATGLLIFIPGQKRKPLNVRKIVGMILSLLISIALIVGTGAIARVNDAISNISGKNTQSKVVAVYVKSDNKAEKISDAKDYRFEIDTQFDAENALKAKEAIQEELGADINVSENAKTMDMIVKLLAGNTDAIILNEAYLDILSGYSKFEDVRNRLKCIYTYEVTDIKEPETEEVEEKPITERPFIVYLSGSDTRNQSLATSRSDVNLLAVINPMSKQVLLLNTPRDYYVLISKSNYTEFDKLTHCGSYGIDCSLDTLGHLYDIDIDYYAQINFEGFKKLVDAIGGITVESDKSFVSEDGFSYAKGTNYLNGEMALSFVRERHAFADGDIQRGKDQMKALVAILEKVKNSPTMLTNYNEIMTSLEGMFTTNVSSDDISSLIKMQLDDGGEWNIVKYGIVGRGAKRTTYTVPDSRAYVMLQNEEENAKAKELIKQVFDGETLSEVE